MKTFAKVALRFLLKKVCFYALKCAAFIRATLVPLVIEAIE
jgi:hypothetical protein